MGLLLLAAVVALVAFGGGDKFGGGAKGNTPTTSKPTTSKPTTSKPTTSKPKAPTTSKPKAPTPTPPAQNLPAGARRWGDLSAIPAAFDWESNALWISPDCDAIAEGALFETASQGAKTIWAIEEPTLAETLGADPQNSVYGFVSYLMEYAQYSSAEAIAEEILLQAAPMCGSLPRSSYPPPLADWFDSLVARITPYVNDQVMAFG